ncbi:hypothetical protein [Polyangium jinanense]|uniref:DUF2846 domain-containing protein n=1 Tax=Polyangium jinanense TaxID=2829994 RepID=A0A9X3X5Y0_9BACT|nr:hypothetical protein [Polyangium jinanense]MDC3954068.1 hypothetical protein [Polyangium jinanense]MDC3981976.1 hypothetical protein [Polyangium jinanense]
MLARRALLLALASLAGLLALSCTKYELALHENAPPGAFGPLPPNAARICVVRPYAVASLVPAVVRDNGRLVGMTKGPSYFCYLAEPGVHKIVSRYGDDVDAELGSDTLVDTTLTAAPGGHYFLHHDVSAILTLSVGWVEAARANEMISECDYAELVDVPSKETLPVPGEIVPASRPQ